MAAHPINHECKYCVLNSLKRYASERHRANPRLLDALDDLVLDYLSQPELTYGQKIN